MGQPFGDLPSIGEPEALAGHAPGITNSITDFGGRSPEYVLGNRFSQSWVCYAPLTDNGASLCEETLLLAPGELKYPTETASCYSRGLWPAPEHSLVAVHDQDEYDSSSSGSRTQASSPGADWTSEGTIAIANTATGYWPVEPHILTIDHHSPPQWNDHCINMHEVHHEQPVVFEAGWAMSTEPTLPHPVDDIQVFPNVERYTTYQLAEHRRDSDEDLPSSDTEGNSQKRRSPRIARSTRQISSTRLSQQAHRRGNTNVRGKGGSGGGPVSKSRQFPCPLAVYGCGATFSSKNEWKRHLGTQHVKLRLWRCDMCPPTVQETDPTGAQIFNDFNRKDLFSQHLRRMHAEHLVGDGTARTKQRRDEVEEAAILNLVERCFKTLRAPPQQCRCPLCPRSFTGPNAWEERTEHLSAHLDHAKRTNSRVPPPNQWFPDPELEEWLQKEGLIEQGANGQWFISGSRVKRISGDDTRRS